MLLVDTSTVLGLEDELELTTCSFFLHDETRKRRKAHEKQANTLIFFELVMFDIKISFL